MIDWGDARFLILGVACLALLVALYAALATQRRWALTEMVGRHMVARLAATVNERAVRWRTGLRFVGADGARDRGRRTALGPRGGEGERPGLGPRVRDGRVDSMDARDVPPSRLEEAQARGADAARRAHRRPRRRGRLRRRRRRALTPLTLDYSAVRILIGSLSSTTVVARRLGPGAGLQTALDLLPEEPARRTGDRLVHRRRGPRGRPAGRRGDDCGAQGMRVFTVGVGTPAGRPSPNATKPDGRSG